MKLKLFIIFFILVFNTIPAWASNLDFYDQIDKIKYIKLAPAEILEANINEALGDPYFLRKTKLHTQLGGRNKSLDEIDIDINFAICDSIDNIKNHDNEMRIYAVLQSYISRYNPLLKEAILKSVVSYIEISRFRDSL